MASIVGTYARAFADVVMRQVLTKTPDGARMKSHLDPDRALRELYGIESLLTQSDSLRRVLENPSIPGDRKRAGLDAITARLRTTRQARHFLALLPNHPSLPLFAE